MPLIIEKFILLLVEIYKIVGDLGLTIIIFTLLTRAALLPFTLKSLKTQKQLKTLQPELKKIKQKHGDDKKSLQLAQVELYKKYNVNPMSGCLPQILQFAVLIVLYQALMTFLTKPVDGLVIDPSFFWLNLAHPDQLYILPVLAGLTQLVLSIMIAPGAEVPDIVPNDSKNKKIKKANEKEEDMAQMAETMQKQMVFMMPIMTAIFALRFPSGLALYWVTTTIISIIQQYFISGWGGLTLYYQRIINMGKKS
ncbi:MAG: YidC/Oxa1 family membrane protein insertase [Patescibacteria group bacterium]